MLAVERANANLVLNGSQERYGTVSAQWLNDTSLAAIHRHNELGSLHVVVWKEQADGDWDIPLGCYIAQADSIEVAMTTYMRTIAKRGARS